MSTPFWKINKGGTTEVFQIGIIPKVICILSILRAPPQKMWNLDNKMKFVVNFKVMREDFTIWIYCMHMHRWNRVIKNGCRAREVRLNFKVIPKAIQWRLFDVLFVIFLFVFQNSLRLHKMKLRQQWNFIAKLYSDCQCMCVCTIYVYVCMYVCIVGI